MKLYCMRHGEAQPVDVDPQCGLSEQGRTDVAKVGQLLAERGLSVSHIMHSPKLRAKQTATIVAECLGLVDALEEEPQLIPDADVEYWVDKVSTWERDTILVGHLPFMAMFVSALVNDNSDASSIVNFAPGTLVCIEHREDRRWVINWMLQPSLL